jgi:hypothetical protein
MLVSRISNAPDEEALKLKLHEESGWNHNLGFVQDAGRDVWIFELGGFDDIIQNDEYMTELYKL